VDGGGNTLEGSPDERWCDEEGEREREREKLEMGSFHLRIISIIIF